MRKYLISLFLIILSLNNLSALKIIDRSSKQRPDWLKEIPCGTLFNYYSGIASSNNSLDEAKNLAISDALSEILMQNEITVEGTVSTYAEESERELISRITKEIKLKGSSTSVKGLEKVEEYWETTQTKINIHYRYWILMKVPKRQYLNYTFTQKELKPTYGIAPIVKSSLIPGWGQIHKGEPKKGVLLLSGFAVTLTSAIVTLNLSESYERDAQNASGSEWITYYNDLSNQYYLVSVASFVLSGALYSYNIFDVISAKGVKIYAFNKTNVLNLSFNHKPSQSLFELSMEF